MKRLARRALPPFAYRAIRARRVAHKISSFDQREVVRRYGEFEFRVLIADPLARDWYDHDWADVPEVSAMVGRGLGPGARVFELGAHQGLLALAAARIVGQAGEVLAVEAQPHNARVAERNCELNDIQNVTVLTAAVMDEPGTARVAAELNSRPLPGARAGTIAVPAVTIDGLVKDYGDPDIVLLDVEGYECLALEGARDVIARQSATFMIEVHANRGLEDAGGSIEEVVSYFSAGGYQLLAAKARDQRRIDDWAPFQPRMPIFDRRFFLMAIPGSR